MNHPFAGKVSFIPREFMAIPGMTATRALIMGRLYVCATMKRTGERDGWFWKSAAQLAEESGTSTSACKRTIQWAIDEGYLEVTTKGEALQDGIEDVGRRYLRENLYRITQAFCDHLSPGTVRPKYLQRRGDHNQAIQSRRRDPR